MKHAADKLLRRINTKEISVPFELFPMETHGCVRNSSTAIKERVLQLRKQNRTETKRCLTEVLIALDHFECSVGDAGVWSSLFVFPKSCVHLFFWLQGMPLGNGAARVGQHVRPVPQLCAGGVVANKYLANGFILPQLVIIQHGDHNLHFLEGEQEDND